MNTVAELNHYIFLFINLELRIHTRALLVFLALTVKARRRKKRHPLERVTIRCTICASAEAMMPTTFRIRSMANVATLPRARERIAGVSRLRDETLLGLGRLGT